MLLPVMLAAGGLLLAGCAGPGDAAAPASGVPASDAAEAATGAVATAPGGVFERVLSNPAVTATGGRLYVAWQVNPVSSALPRFELARVDPASGAIKATHRFAGGYLGAPLAAGGWLWVATSAARGESVLRMNPADLAVSADIRIGESGQGGGRDHLAAAGGALWVTDGSRLLRVSVPAGKVTAAISLPGAYSSDEGASPDGRVLVIGEADGGGLGSVQRRDPVTGTLLASRAMTGVTAPEVGGVTDSGAWVSEPTGMLGYVERFSTGTMAPDPATDVSGTNGIEARISAGAVWITDPVGSDRNYCADPVTGRVLARIPLPAQAYLLAISGGYLYDQVLAGDGFRLSRAPVPAACRVLRPPGRFSARRHQVVFTCPLPTTTGGNTWRASSSLMRPDTPAAPRPRPPCITPRHRCTWRFPATCSTGPASSC
jgi:hypothetical protein